jgi:hypothetical protein
MLAVNILLVCQQYNTLLAHQQIGVLAVFHGPRVKMLDTIKIIAVAPARWCPSIFFLLTAHHLVLRQQ